MKMRVWPDGPIRWAPPGTAAARTSPSTRNTPRASSCACSIRPTSERSRSASRLAEQTDMVWHAYLPDVLPGPALRLSRARPYEPAEGPSLQSEQGAARSLRQGDRPRNALGRRDVGLQRRRSARPICRSTSATTRAFAPLAAVIDEAFTWGDDRPPQTPWHKTLIYEVHVKGFTKLHPDVPEKLRGTYAGLELRAGDSLSARTWASRPSSCCRCTSTSTTGTWSSAAWSTTGATTRSASSPRTRAMRRPTAPRDAVREFKTMVRNLHAAGIEVILDVVYNHTAEGNQLGPTLSFRGIDNAVVLPAVARGSALLHGLHRLRQHVQHAQSARAAADHGQPALLGHATCTSTGSASIWPARWPASCTKSTSWARSSTSSTRIRSSRRSS